MFRAQRSVVRLPACAVPALLALVLVSPRPVSAAVSVQIGQNFAGSKYGVDSNAQPADADGAAGPQHFVEFINGRFSVYDKATGQRVKTMTDLGFWSSAGVSLGASLDVTDPRVVFDAASQRWFASEVDLDTTATDPVNNRFLLAVSGGADPTGSWTGFAFQADPVNQNFADFPTLGVDADGVYLGGDLFNGLGISIRPTLVAIPKSDLLAHPPTVANRKSFGALSYGGNGTILQPAVTSGKASTGEAVLAVADVAIDQNMHSTLLDTVITGTGSAGGATVTSHAPLTVPDYTAPLNPTQPDGSTALDDGDARIGALVYRIDDVLYAVHSTEVNNQAAIQWFKINATNFTVIQTGILTDSQLDLFYPSIAANGSGTVVICCNGCSASTFVSSYAYVGETVNGVLSFGSLQLLHAGTASYRNLDSTGVSRWGDYSATSVDPADPNRFWTIQMIATGRRTWTTQITELITSGSSGPVSLAIQSSDTNIVIRWPDTAAGYSLQSTPDLSVTPGWTAVGPNPTSTNGHFSVSLPLGPGRAFYRLVKP